VCRISILLPIAGPGLAGNALWRRDPTGMRNELATLDDEDDGAIISVDGIPLGLGEHATHTAREHNSGLVGFDGHFAVHDQERCGVSEGGCVDLRKRTEVSAALMAFARAVGEGTKRTFLEKNPRRGSVAPSVKWMTSI
jgi:hypothetical protein